MRGCLKALAIVTVMLLGSATTAVADNDVGCGVGTMMWEGKKGVGPKLLASFTNGLLFQSISITFGLINCNGSDTVTADAREMRLRHYASTNFDELARDMARGGGDHLDAFASLMDVDATDRAAFASLTQRGFGDLFTHDRVTVGEMLTALDRLMEDDPTLNVYTRT